MPVVGVEQTYFSIWAIPQYADPDDMWFFTTDFAIPNFEFALPQEKCGLKVWSKLWEPELSKRGDSASFHWIISPCRVTGTACSDVQKQAIHKHLKLELILTESRKRGNRQFQQK